MEKQVNKLRIQKDVRTALRTAGSAIGNKLGVRPAGKLPNRVKLLVSIVNRNDEVRLKETIDEVSVSLTVKFEGVGTAHSQVLDYLGIGETEKTVAFSLIPESDEEKIMREIRTKMSLYLVGRGISFTVPLTGISEIVANGITSAAADKGERRFGFLPVCRHDASGLWREVKNCRRKNYNAAGPAEY